MKTRKNRRAEETVRSQAMDAAVRELEEAERVVGKAYHRAIARAGHSPELASVQKARVRRKTEAAWKEIPVALRLRTEKSMAGARTRFHPSKKGLGKTTSGRARRRLELSD